MHQMFWKLIADLWLVPSVNSSHAVVRLYDLIPVCGRRLLMRSTDMQLVYDSRPTLRLSDISAAAYLVLADHFVCVVPKFTVTWSMIPKMKWLHHNSHTHNISLNTRVPTTHWRHVNDSHTRNKQITQIPINYMYNWHIHSILPMSVGSVNCASSSIQRTPPVQQLSLYIIRCSSHTTQGIWRYTHSNRTDRWNMDWSQ